MLKICGKNELNQISLTGVRAIAFIGLLAIRPMSMAEIRNYFLKYKLLEPNQPDDILRIDLNTIKAIGCEVSRACKKTDYKYVLTNHPFKLTLSEKDVNYLKKVYNKFKANADISVIFKYDDLFRKLADNVCDYEIKEKLLGISVLKHYNIECVKRLYNSRNKKIMFCLTYHKPTSVRETIKNIYVQKLDFVNGKIYLYGYDADKKANTTLNCMHIKNIISESQVSLPAEENNVNVIFKLNINDFDFLTENEIIKESNDEYALIEGSYFNNFFAVQRILSFGSRCTVEAPEEIKNMVISKLKDMRRVYETGK